MGNKKDIMRKGIAPKTFVFHPKQILEKTQTEAFLQFKHDNSGIKMGQRIFEKCKPFYVIAPRRQDRNTCFSHGNAYGIWVVHGFSMESTESTCKRFPVYEQIRSCNDCGMSKINLMPEEQCFEEDSPRVKWQAF